MSLFTKRGQLRNGCDGRNGENCRGTRRGERRFVFNSAFDPNPATILLARMKSAYELAMERLQKQQPSIALTDEQKKELADVDATFKAKIAEKELFLKEQLQKAQTSEKFEEVEAIEKQLAAEVRRLQQDCESKKEKLRANFGR